MKISDKLKSLGPDEGFISLEFFPPKTDNGFKNLLQRIERMSILKPLFVSITWGAGGTTAQRSLELAGYCQQQLNLTVCLHLTCTNTSLEIIDNALLQAKKLGIRNILALRGDPPRDEIENSSTELNYAKDLVKYIKIKYGDYFDIGVAAYPDGHVEGADSSQQDYEKDLPYLVEKVKAGADFILTQLFFNIDQYLKFEDKVLSIPELEKTYLIPGLIPINNYQLFQRVSKLSHAMIPKSILNKFPTNAIQNDDRKVKEIGVEILDDLITQLTNRSRTRGIHFYSLNLESSIAKLVETSSILQKYTKIDNVSTTEEISERDILSISTGAGTLGKEATWDEFPNGRFGDSRSPAYGEIDGYGPSLKIPFGYTNLIDDSLWGTPQTLSDISTLFCDFLCKKVPSLPFSDLEISAETLLIQEELLSINSKNWFSLSSQPAINTCPSNDSIFGWGGRNGYIYQKAYIELLISAKDWDKVLKPKIETHNKEEESQGNPTISYYVANHSKRWETNIEPNNRTSAVTWGVFPNKEIVQSTIIEEQSFKAWKDEVFKIIQDWKQLYLLSWKNEKLKKYKKSYDLIKQLHDEFVLVTIFDNNFQNEDSLWSVLDD